MVIMFNDREVEISVYGQHSDDVQIDSAVYLDTNEDLTDAEVDELYEYFQDQIDEAWFNLQLLRGDFRD